MRKRILLALLLAVPVLAGDAYLFTSFRGNGESGLFLAISRDGKQWKALNKGNSWMKVEIPGMLMRDPFLVQGPDGVFHLLWTTGWTRNRETGRLTIGYSDSRDLITWTRQREIEVMPDEPTARNAWAPEAVWDPKQKEWVIFWATTIPGRFPSGEASGDDSYNHRLYFITTRDWVTFSPAKLWFDPGFNSIDSTVVQDGKRWVMVFKDERKTPLQKKLRVAFADSPRGPWRDVSAPISRDWVEGPTAARIGSEWWIFFDHYTKPQHYGAIRTRDWKTFEDVTAQVSFPPGQRHGSILKVSEKLAEQLEAQQR